MDTNDQSLGLLPTFSQPSSRRLDPDLPEEPGTDSPDGNPSDSPSQPGISPDLDAPNTPKPGTAGTPTSTSGGSGKRPASKVDQETAAGLIVGILGLAATGLALYITWSSGRRKKLREPTPGETRDIAEPLARIALRHIDPSLLNADLADGLMAGAAVGTYLKNGPVTHYIAAEPPLRPREEQP